ncbi:MAG: radical SAM protein [Clostridia bacterium]|nr:radical SAM protein [Clostridia bacterium]
MKHANISLFVPHMGCPHQCSFCNQKTISGAVSELTPDDVTTTLEKAVADGINPESTEIAFFGGSFTAIERDYMVSLLEATRPFVDAKQFSGIRISTRPDAIDEEVLRLLKRYGVTSIELGAQSTDPEVLVKNRRGHSREDIFNASRLIKKQGFSLGLQMMTGLLGDTYEKSLQTCEDIISLKPDTVRIYPTITLAGTYLGECYKAGEYEPQSLDEAVSLCGRLLKRFYDNSISVIRLGLHSGGNVEEGYLAGPYHPAFGEMCQSAVYYENAVALLKTLDAHNKNVTLYVNPSEISKMTGQKGANKEKLRSMGYNVVIKGDSTLDKLRIKAEINER